jgi:hypothetical protein
VFHGNPLWKRMNDGEDVHAPCPPRRLSDVIYMVDVDPINTSALLIWICMYV